MPWVVPGCGLGLEFRPFVPSPGLLTPGPWCPLLSKGPSPGAASAAPPGAKNTWKTPAGEGGRGRRQPHLLPVPVPGIPVGLLGPEGEAQTDPSSGARPAPGYHRQLELAGFGWDPGYGVRAGPGSPSPADGCPRKWACRTTQEQGVPAQEGLRVERQRPGCGLPGAPALPSPELILLPSGIKRSLSLVTRHQTPAWGVHSCAALGVQVPGPGSGAGSALLTCSPPAPGPLHPLHPVRPGHRQRDTSARPVPIRNAVIPRVCSGSLCAGHCLARSSQR